GLGDVYKRQSQHTIKYALPYLQVDFAMVQSCRTGAQKRLLWLS
ncbi:hypothetical protein ACN6QF_17425, partial [Acinetobacter baumannii]